MDFFKQLYKTDIKNVLLDIHFENDIATVCIVPKTFAKEQAFNTLKPLIITKGVEEIDAIFFDRVSKPLKLTQTAFDNTVDYEIQCLTSL